VHGTPAVSGGVAYVSGCDEVFHGIRLADGVEVVQFPADGPAAASPAIIGEWAWFGNFNNEVVGASVRTEAHSMAFTSGRPRSSRFTLRRRRPATASWWGGGTRRSTA